MSKQIYTHVASGVDFDGWYKYTLRRSDGKQTKVNKARFRKLRDDGRISNVPPLGSTPDSPFYKEAT